MIRNNYIIPKHERSPFDVIADACWCVLSMLERDYPCFRAMYGDPEYPEDGPEPRTNRNIKKLGHSMDPTRVMECIHGVIKDAFTEAGQYVLPEETEFKEWLYNGIEISDDYNEMIRRIEPLYDIKLDLGEEQP